MEKHNESIPCCICGGGIEVDKRSGWNQGHNAWPVVADGRCCDDCNANVVIPERIKRAENMEKKDSSLDSVFE